MEADLLPLDFARIAGNKARLGESRLEQCIVIDQGPCDAVSDGAGLAGIAATGDVHHDVEGGTVLSQFERLTHHDALSRRLEVMDSTALSLCMDNRLPIIVFDLGATGNVLRILRGEHVGTLVTAEL